MVPFLTNMNDRNMKGYSPDGITGKALLSNWRGFLVRINFLPFLQLAGMQPRRKMGIPLTLCYLFSSGGTSSGNSSGFS
jgi:hypothetical protein